MAPELLAAFALVLFATLLLPSPSLPPHAFRTFPPQLKSLRSAVTESSRKTTTTPSDGQVEGPGWADRAGTVLLLLEGLVRRVLPHHITCRSSNRCSLAADNLYFSLGECLAGKGGDSRGSRDGLLPRLVSAALERPALQPRVLALILSLSKLSHR